MLDFVMQHPALCSIVTAVVIGAAVVFMLQERLYSRAENDLETAVSVICSGVLAMPGEVTDKQLVEIIASKLSVSALRSKDILQHTIRKFPSIASRIEFTGTLNV